MSIVKQHKFSIREIRAYLEGCKLCDGSGKFLAEWNVALKNAIHELEDKHDGIAATTERDKKNLKAAEFLDIT